MPTNAREHRNRVKDQSTSPGAGTFTVDGVAPTGYQTITAAHTTGATVGYAAYNSTASEWEVGQGVWTAAGTTLTRDVIYASSNSGNIVTFSAGTITLITTPLANDADLPMGRITALAMNWALP